VIFFVLTWKLFSYLQSANTSGEVQLQREPGLEGGWGGDQTVHAGEGPPGLGPGGGRGQVRILAIAWTGGRAGRRSDSTCRRGSTWTGPLGRGRTGENISYSLDWRKGGEEIRQYMQERVHLDWALGEGEDR
jgi:hypothetical protein